MFDRKLSLEVKHTEETIWKIEELIEAETDKEARNFWVSDLAYYDQYLAQLAERCRRAGDPRP